MDRNHFEKQWSSLKKEVQLRWNKLTDGDIHQIDGMFDHLVQALKNRYGYSTEHAEREIQNWNVGAKGSIKENKWETPQNKTAHCDTKKHPMSSSHKENLTSHENKNQDEWKKKKKAG